MSVRITPAEAYQRIERGEAVLIDIRDADEYMREHIASATHIPLAQFDNMTRGSVKPPEGGIVVFHCLSGNRTVNNAEKLSACVNGEVFILDGGITAWKKAGLPVVEDKSQPLPIMRQVQIIAGFLVLLGVMLGALASPWFYLLSAFVGAGLMFAGFTGFCGMAVLLMKMPWNRPKSGA